jgi:Bacterial conjugation TrbI-like protein
MANPSNLPENSSSQSGEWEQRMSKLVGFEEEITPSETERGELITIENTESSLVEQNPHLAKTSSPLSGNPFAKVAVVGTSTLLVVLVAGTFLSQMINGTNKKPKNNVVTQKKPQIEELDEFKPEAEIEVLKTKLALAEQAKAVKNAQLQLKTAPANIATQARNNRNIQISQVPSQIQPQIQTRVVTRDVPRVIIQKVPGEMRTVFVPRTVTVERIVRVPQTVSQARPTTASRVTSTTSPRTSRANVPIARPTATPTATPSTTPTPIASAIPTPNNPLSPSLVNPVSTPSPLNTTPPDTTSMPFAQQRNQQAAEQTEKDKSVAVGTSVKGVLATALFGETSKSESDNDKNDSTFVVRLKEPLKAVDGSVVLTPGTELLTQIRRITDTGLVQLDVNSIIVQKDGKLTETKLQQGAMKIRFPKGKPLMANKYPDRGRSIAGMDAGLFVLGGIGKAAELFNRPDTTINITSGSSITQTNTRPNIATGVLEGGLNSLVPQITLRNQQAISEMSTRGNIWFLPAGTELEVFVNQITRF